MLRLTPAFSAPDQHTRHKHDESRQEETRREGQEKIMSCQVFNLEFYTRNVPGLFRVLKQDALGMSLLFSTTSMLNL